MNLFSEIYSAYYNSVAKILSKENVTISEMNSIISENAFSESALYIIPKLSDEWNLISKTSLGFSSVLKGKSNISLPLTTLEKRWVKALLEDERIKLFIKNEQLMNFQKQLQDVSPLFNVNDFYYFDRFSDGDDYLDENYIKNFRTIREAIATKEILIANYKTGKSQEMYMRFVPIFIEYSMKNDKFRVYVFKLRYKKKMKICSLNVSRISDIVRSGEFKNFKINADSFLKTKRCENPAILRISPNRNGVERFLMEFASYEKRTEIDKETGICTVKLWYDKQDETEILIKLLSFGPVLEILGCESLRQQAKERIKKQYELLYNQNGELY